MKRKDAVLVAIFCICFGWAARGAHASDRGLAPAVRVTETLAIPDDGLWRAPQRPFILPETLQVYDRSSVHFRRVDGDPGKGEYRLRLDGAIRFNAKDKGRKVTVAYTYEPRRFVLLSPLTSDYGNEIPVLTRATTEALAAHGLVKVPVDDEADAVARFKKQHPEGLDDTGRAKLYLRLAEECNAAYIVLQAVGSSDQDVMNGLQSWTSFNRGGVFSAAYPTKVATVSTCVGFLIWDGNTGNLLYHQTRSRWDTVTFRNFSGTRKSLIEDLVPKAIAEWFEEL